MCFCISKGILEHRIRHDLAGPCCNPDELQNRYLIHIHCVLEGHEGCNHIHVDTHFLHL
jgi:hypothetical protein